LAIPPEEISKARQLVHRLGSEVYREREEAQAQLAKMGRLARPALLEAFASDPDPEVRFRCSRLLPRAGADDLKARLDTFLADTDSKYDHDLPGLKPFRKITGSDRQARDLFVEIFKSPHNIELLEMLDKSPAEAGRAIADRRSMLWGMLQQRNNFNGRFQPQQPIPLTDIACLLFAESVTPSKEIPRNNMFAFVTGVFFVTQPSSMSVLRGEDSPRAEVYKRIIGHWMESRDDVNELNQLPDMVGPQLRGFKETTPLLRRIAKHEGVTGYAKARSLMYLMQQRGKEEVDFVRSFLTNDSPVTSVWFGGNVNQQVPMQLQSLLKDVALAMLITDSGQKMIDYGYLIPPGMPVPNLQNIGYGNYAFPNEQARAAAMVKFGFWRMKQSPNKDAAAASSAKESAPTPAEKK
jgi:hypothetical protein